MNDAQTIWIVDAHTGGDGKRCVVHADEKLTAFVKLESAIRACGDRLRLTERKIDLQEVFRLAVTGTHQITLTSL